MRLAIVSLSAVLLSGCSWLGGMSKPDNRYQNNARASYANGAPSHHMGVRGPHNPCMVYSPVQPVPQGCDPASVTLATGYNSGAVQPGGNYATGGYGSHAGNAHNVGQQAKSGPRLRKPRLRGALTLGTEKSVSGELLNFNNVGGVALYNPALFEESRVERSGVTAAGYTDTTTTYSSVVEGIEAPTLSFDDVYNTPVVVKGGLEYIMSPKYTVFANAGYAHAEGTDDARASVRASLTREISAQNFDNMDVAVGTPLANGTFIPNETVANFIYDFNDQRRYDLELGGRRYFNPIMRDSGHRTVTPFVGAAIGVSHVNEVTYETRQNQRYLERGFENNSNDFYDVPALGGVNQLYDDAWLLNGALTGGMEWQVTPGTALALETGVKFEQGRDLVGGSSGDDNISVPVTLRGSFNF